MNRSPMRLVVVTSVVVAGLTWWLATSPTSPVNPHPQRPIVTALARLVRTAARLGLWMALAAEESPKPKEQPEDRPRLVQASDVEGVPRVDHSEGW